MKTKNVKATPNRGTQQKADEIQREIVRLKTELSGIFNCPDPSAILSKTQSKTVPLTQK